MIKATDVLYARFRAPDLDRMETFLTDFGLVRAARTDRALYMRGTDPRHHIHVTELGEPAFLGIGIQAATVADLERLARAPGASGVEPIDEPGGGFRVRLTDPNGIAIEVVHGIEPVPALAVPARVINTGAERSRRGVRQHVARGPAHVKRLGHFVLIVEDFRATEAFYHARLGFLNSDEIHLPGAREQVLGAFMRLDRGDEYVDHHAFLAIGAGMVQLNHVAFEVQDYDDLMAGNERLVEAGYEHHWGVGRHMLGGQVFDYWRDPFGTVVEHWTDGDLFDARSETGAFAIGDPAMGNFWGPPPPSPFGA